VAIQTLSFSNLLGNGQLPRNPRPNSLRVDGRYVVSFTEFGVQIPSLWGYRSSIGDDEFAVYYATWIDSEGTPNVTPLCKTVNSPPAAGIQFGTWRMAVEKREDPTFGTQWEVRGAVWFAAAMRWGDGVSRYAGSRPAKWDSSITRSTVTPDLFPIAQSNFEPGFVERFTLPKDGPPQPGFEWPPQFAEFWLDQL